MLPKVFCLLWALLCLLVFATPRYSFRQRKLTPTNAPADTDRTAICITGGRVHALHHQWKDVLSTQETKYYEQFHSKQGEVAQSVIENVFKPLSKSGLDVFMLVQTIGLSTDSTPVPGNLSACDPLVDNSIFSIRGTGNPPSNHFFCQVMKEERLLNEFRELNPLWATSVYKLKHAREELLQQLFGLYECNNAINEYAVARNISYKYKIRLRPDMAWLDPINCPNLLDFKGSSAGMSKIYVQFNDKYPDSNVDYFAFGLTSDMDVYFDEYLEITHGVNHVSKLREWDHGQYLRAYLLSKNIMLDTSNGGFRGIPVHSKIVHSNNMHAQNLMGSLDWKDVSANIALGEGEELLTSNTTEVSLSPKKLPRCCCMGSGANARCWPPPDVAGGKRYVILWHANQFGPRGTEVSLYDYASSFEEFLCGESHVDAFGVDSIEGRMHVEAFGAESVEGRMPYPDSLISLPKFKKRFPGRTHLLMRDGKTELDELLSNISANAFYATQFGTREGTRVWPTPEKGGKVKTLLHAVFYGTEPHFDSYAVIGDTVPRSPGVPVVHYLTYVNPTFLALPDLRSDWKVPADARVFCRHGGAVTFNIPFVRQAVCDHAASHPNDYFVLLGTNEVACDKDHKNIIHLAKTTDLAYKQQYLNSCNACIHARSDGETFGLGVAECSMTGLPVITFCAPPKIAAEHIRILGKEGMLYCDAPTLLSMLDGFDVVAAKAKRDVYKSLYAAYAPGTIMLEFMTNFKILDHFMGITNPHNMSFEGHCEPFLALPVKQGV